MNAMNITAPTGDRIKKLFKYYFEPKEKHIKLLENYYPQDRKNY